ncbi:alkaline phosphatase family protein [Komagataeibacter rhaeticus]|uniref:alkaline phosphatase family protein n=1 Tax=Komagataeibacter rhaeticus TaxID=215221 RepID=UPI0038D10E02
MPPDIRYVVVLMLENRSFDCMLGQLYTDREDFDGLKGTETNTWHDGKTNPTYPVRTDPTDGPADMFTPNPDPGEQFTDIAMQIHGKSGCQSALKNNP